LDIFSCLSKNRDFLRPLIFQLTKPAAQSGFVDFAADFQFYSFSTETRNKKAQLSLQRRTTAYTVFVAVLTFKVIQGR